VDLLAEVGELYRNGIEQADDVELVQDGVFVFSMHSGQVLALNKIQDLLAKNTSKVNSTERVGDEANLAVAKKPKLHQHDDRAHLNKGMVLKVRVIAGLVRVTFPADRLDIPQVFWLNDIEEPVCNHGATAVLEDEVVRALEHWQSFFSNQSSSFKNARPGCHAWVFMTFAGEVVVVVSVFAFWCEIVGGDQIEGPRLSACEVDASSRNCSRGVGEHAGRF
jgi:hypothetical protein